MNYLPFSQAEQNFLDLHCLVPFTHRGCKPGDTFRVRAPSGDIYYLMRGFPDHWSEVLRHPPSETSGNNFISERYTKEALEYLGSELVLAKVINQNG